MKKIIDRGNLIVVALTFILFIIALFEKGITKDLLLEAGVLLVSIKLIMFNYAQSLLNKETIHRLDEIRKVLTEIKSERVRDHEVFPGSHR